MGSLSNLYISQSYQSLIHLATNNTASATLIGLEDGLGNSIGVSVNTAGNLYLSGTFSASLQEGYIYVGNSSGRTIAFPTSSFISELETGSLLTTASFNAYTASTNIRLSNIEITTASVLVSISNLNASSASQQVSINALNVFTQSANIRLNNLETTSASVNTSITNINAYTQSNDLKWQDLGSKSGSWITESETGSFARWDVSNPWSANQNFTNITAVSASFTYVQTVFETASVIYSSGSNQFGDELTDIQTLSGSVKIRGGLLINNLDVTGSINNINSFTQSTNVRINNLETTSASVNISISNLNTFTASISTASIVTSINNLNSFTQSANIRLNNLESTSASVNTSISNLNSFSASTLVSINALNSATASYVTEAESGSFLITASFDNGTRNLTFTKGDASTFAVNIPDVSGSQGTFVTTSSFNAYTGSNDQRVSSLESNSASVNTSITNINLFTQSADQRLDSIEAQSGSWVTSAITGSSIITASVTDDDITFTKGDGSTFTIQVATGSFALSASFATSASYAETASYAQFATDIYLNVKNTTGAQLNKGTVVRIIGATGDNALIATASWEDDNNSANTLGFLYENIPNDSFGKVITQGTLLGIDTDPVLGYTAGQIIYLSSSGQYTNVIPPAPYHEVRLGQVLRAQQNNGSVYVLIQNGYELSELHDVDINTGSLANNNVLAYNSASTQWENKTLTEVGATTTASFNAYTQSTDARLNNIEAATGSYVTETESGSFLLTASFSETTRNITFTKGNNTTFNLGGFATTGSNVFRGTETFEDAAGNWSSLHPISGGFYLVARGSNSASAHISSSNASLAAANGLTNIVFKTNNNTADTILSGSSNIFTNPGAPTAGFKRYLTAGNLSLMGGIPQISGNMAFSPTITSNILAYPAATSNPMTIRGPVSSSAYSISTNLLLGGALNLGTSAANHFQQAVNGVTIVNNLIGGTFALVANRTRLTQVVSIGGNQGQGNTTLNMNSSSIDLSTSLFYGTNTFNNNSSGSSRVSAAGNAVGIQQAAFVGVNTMTFSGSNDPNDAQDLDYNGGIYRSLIVGSNSPFVLTGPTGSNSLSNTGIIGNNLIVTGSSGNPVFGGITTGHGSLFTGRFNADGTRNRSSENVFVVGTGTSTTARKTGFLIDSGSNTFIEGTLNISGSSTLSGSLYIQSGSTLPASTGSAILTWNAATGQVNQASFSTIVSASVSSAEFSSTVTQSGSAGVSGSLSFNNSGSFYNVSLVNGKEIKVTNGGVYNIQFSAQVETSAGADTVYLWYKKNGNNISDTARKALLANNTAQVVTVSILDEAQANDYYEIGYQTQNGNATILAEAASGNIPAIPSVIATIFQIR